MRTNAVAGKRCVCMEAATRTCPPRQVSMLPRMWAFASAAASRPWLLVPTTRANMQSYHSDHKNPEGTTAQRSNPTANSKLLQSTPAHKALELAQKTHTMTQKRNQS
jgi:hypothetical protein